MRTGRGEGAFTPDLTQGVRVQMAGRTLSPRGRGQSEGWSCRTDLFSFIQQIRPPGLRQAGCLLSPPGLDRAVVPERRISGTSMPRNEGGLV